jgi:hypothetical protein
MAAALLVNILMMPSLPEIFSNDDSSSRFPCTYKDGRIFVADDNLSSAAQDAAEALQAFSFAMGPEATDGLMCHVLQVCERVETANCGSPPRRMRCKAQPLINRLRDVRPQGRSDEQLAPLSASRQRVQRLASRRTLHRSASRRRSARLTSRRR